MLNKKILALLLLLAVVRISLIPDVYAAESPESETVTLAVDNMTCRMCPITVRKALGKLDGVIHAEADYQSKTATVKFDPQKVRIEDLIAATTNAGYPSHPKTSP